MTTLLIARHGNTFDAGDTLLRVGAGTDLPLSESGKIQGRLLGEFLQQEGLIPDVVYSSALKRQKETAELALKAMDLSLPLTETEIFTEIHYGPDEGMPEEDVVARLGQEALDAWDTDAVVPGGWNVDPDALIQNWQKFGQDIQTSHPNQTVLVVTSNGVARFAPHLTGDFEGFKTQHKIKLSTGAVSKFSADGEKWDVGFWNAKPKEMLDAA